jgi:tRNA pseudouridine55 synthase
MNGILLVDKPRGWTSFDVVAKVRSVARQATGQKKPKVGHTGTLDPLATGLLVLVVGSYTKRAPELTKLDKTYEVTMKLGETSTTGDEEGTKTSVSAMQPPIQDIRAAVEQFVGDIVQVPPAYSAIKVNGQRAYKLARAGKTVELEPRPVTIHGITEVAYDYPIVRFVADVSSGTYIRTLVEDIGTSLKTGAYMTGLRRTRVGQFSLDNAVAVHDLVPDSLAGRLLT